MTKKQMYVTGGVGVVILIGAVAALSYFIFTFRNNFLAEQELRIKFQDKSGNLERELATTQAELEAKNTKIDILEGTIDDIKKRTNKLSEAKAQVEAERERLLAEKRKQQEEFRDLRESLQQEIANQEITITQLQGQLTVNLMDKILFDSGRADIKPEGKKVLDKIADTFLNRFPDREIRVEGHTDDRPFRGSPLENWDLSAARAISAVRYLQAYASVDSSRLSATGYAFYRPIDTNDTPGGRARNRRIEIIVMPPKKKAAQEEQGLQ